MKKILVVDDSSIVQNLVKKILEQQHFEVVSAKNGEEAIKNFKKEDISLILMDINMPVMDGMECSKAIRSMDNKEKSSVPIIIISGNLKNYTMDDFKATGINEFLQKPLDFDVLVSLVLKYTS